MEHKSEEVIRSKAESNVDKPCTSELLIPFPSNHYATMVMQCLEVDDELQPNRLEKTLQVNDNVLKVTFAGSDLKILRVGMSSFFDMVIVATKTLLEFEDDIVV